MAGAEAMAALDARLAGWIRAAGHDRAPLREDAPRGEGMGVHLRRLGWTHEPAPGRTASGLRFTAEFLVTVVGPDGAASDGLLADLAALGPDFADRVAPLPPDAPLWERLGLAPRPALRAALAFDARAPAAEPPAIARTELRIAPLRRGRPPLSQIEPEA